VGSTLRIPSRLAVFCLAVAYFLLQLGGAWHLSQQGHARCAAHGEWIDVAHPSTAKAPAPHAGPVVDSAASSSEHDHCAVVEASRVRAIVQDLAPLGLLHEPLVSIVLPRADVPMDVGFDRYLLAPKQSPPC
jgi:hypothetical protein